MRRPFRPPPSLGRRRHLASGRPDAGPASAAGPDLVPAGLGSPLRPAPGAAGQCPALAAVAATGGHRKRAVGVGRKELSRAEVAGTRGSRGLSRSRCRSRAPRGSAGGGGWRCQPRGTRPVKVQGPRQRQFQGSAATRWPSAPGASSDPAEKHGAVGRDAHVRHLPTGKRVLSADVLWKKNRV